MVIPKTHPNYDELIARLEALKTMIAEKREEALRLFEAVLATYQEMQHSGVRIPKKLQEQMEFIKRLLNIGDASPDKMDDTTKQLEELCARLSIDEVVKAISSMVISHEQKTQITIEKFKEDLKKQLSVRLAEESRSIAGSWKSQVRATDIVNTLNQQGYKDIASHFGGASKMTEQALKLADNFSNVLGKISDQSYQQNAGAGKDMGQGR